MKRSLKLSVKKVGLDVERILLGSEIDTMTDQELAKLWKQQRSLPNYHPIKKRGSSSASRIMATRLVTWEMVSTMLHLWRSQTLGSPWIPLLILPKKRQMSSFWIRTWWSLKKVWLKDARSMPIWPSTSRWRSLLTSGISSLFSLPASFYLSFQWRQFIWLCSISSMIFPVSPFLLTMLIRNFLKKPRIWEANSIMRFMAWIGPISSVFDIITYMLLYFILLSQWF